MFSHSPAPHRSPYRLLPAAFVIACLLPLAAALAQAPTPTPRQDAGAAQPAPSGGAVPNVNAPGGAPNPAPNPQTAPTPFPITIGAVKVADAKPGEPVVAGLNYEIIVTVNNLMEEVDRQAQSSDPAAGLDPNRLVLFLDDVEMKKLYPEAVIPQSNELRFKLRRDDETKEAWDDLLARPESATRSNLKVGVGPEGKTAWPQDKNVKQNFTLRVYDRTWLNWGAVLFLIAVAIFLWLAKISNIVRDSQPPEPAEGASKPYSLARVQVAWWFFIILGSFLFLLLVTRDYNTLNTQALVLLGIGTGTALGSAMIDANKRESATGDLRTLKPQQVTLAAVVTELRAKAADVEARRAAGQDVTPDELTALGGWRTELAAKEAELAQLNVEVADVESARSKPVSAGFIRDVLSDVNGVAFHRFQIIVWTLVLGFIFMSRVWSTLRMPEFDDKLLALMGISAGTYLGFKIPERQTESSSAAAPPTPPIPPTLPTPPTPPATPTPPAIPPTPPAQPPAGAEGASGQVGDGGQVDADTSADAEVPADENVPADESVAADENVTDENEGAVVADEVEETEGEAEGAVAADEVVEEPEEAPRQKKGRGPRAGA